jgi:uncharacterized membrane protein
VRSKGEQPQAKLGGVTSLWDGPASGRRLATLAALGALTALVVAMVAVRVAATRTDAYLNLPWNLFLAWIPFCVALLVYDQARRGARTLPLLGLAGVWLLFFPNAPYLVTDIVHIDPLGGQGVSSLLGTLALVAAAPAGLALGFSSLLLVERNLRGRFGGKVALTVSVLSLAAACVGIYLGRVVRLNSWDLLARPRDVLYAVHANALDPHPVAAVGTVALAAVLATLYLRFRRVAQ